ncbi:MAG TPA: DUF6600 domain-containing protein [Candidatus Acidoferrales bacterium]|nr:DUF6600 domain-containing protein [Candidatus Acidoferrales bacterium]
MKKRFYVPLIFILFLAGLFAAQQQAFGQEDQQNPPTRVADLNYAQGSVSYQPYGDQQWYQADLDRPLTTGDNLWSDQNSRAEVHVGSTAFRMGDQTGISFLNLNDNSVQVQLAQGTLEISVARLGPDDAYEIDAPNLAFSILRPGEYRLDADPNGNSTVVTVYSGEGTVTGGGQTFNVMPLQQAEFTGTNQLSENVQGAPGPDGFEEWARSREYHEMHAVSDRYLSPEVAGYEDLDEYGSWRYDAEYGNYWVPRDIAPDWQPYHEGHWVWIAPWGWTWVDYEPWGFTPFHYGRWAMIGGAWGWVPGPVAVAPVYAPALVGFVGGGGFGVGIQFGFGVGVGWFPLGPQDVYIPPYQVTPQYVQEINISNSRVINQTIVTNVYNNYTVNHVTNVSYTYANNARAVTVVSRQAFVSGQPVQKSAMRVDPAQIQHPRVVTTAALTPTRASIAGAATPARAKPQVRIANRPLVTKMQPSPRAEPIGRPRPATPPSLQPAVLRRSGYSAQLQTVRATAAARAPARGGPPQPNRPAARPQPGAPTRPEAAPNRTQPTAPPNRQPARPTFTPPNRTTAPRTAPNRARPAEPPNRQPARPTFTPPNRATAPRTAPNRARPAEPPNRQPARPTFTPPNRATAPRTAPNRARPAEPPNRQPARPTFTPPNRATPPRTAPNREQPRAPYRAIPPRTPENPPRAIAPRNRPSAQPRPPRAVPHKAPPPKKPPKKKPGQPHGQPQQPGPDLA